MDDSGRVPAKSPTTHLVVVLIVSVLTLLSVLREVSTPIVDSLWAEDGPIFLGGALRDGWGSVLDGYNGYFHVVARLLAIAVSLFPALLWPWVISLATALISSAVALYIFYASADVIGSLVLRAMLAAWILINPLTGEVASNLANLHWYLLVGAFWAFFAPPSMKSASFALVAASALSNPFTGVLGAVGLVSKRNPTLGWVALFGSLAHVLGQFMGDAVVDPSFAEPSIASASTGLVVATWGVLGSVVGGRLATTLLISGVGAVALLGTTALLFLAGYHATKKWFYVTCAVLGLGVPVGGAVARGADRAFEIQRFGFVTAALAIALLLTAIDRFPRMIPLVGLALGLTLSLNFPLFTRDDSPRWSEALELAECSQGEFVDIPIEPDGWSFNVPCGRL